MRHIRHKIEEAKYFLGGMNHFAQELDDLIGLGGNAFTSPGAYGNVLQFQFHFSAMLNAWKTVSNYVEKKCMRVPGNPAALWAIEKSKLPVIESFRLLRNSDAHGAVAQTAHQTKITPSSGELHAGAVERNLVLDKSELERSPKLSGHSNLIQLLTDKPLVLVAEDALATLISLVDEAQTKGYLK